MFLSGNLLVVASTTSIVAALTWGGVQYSWSSAHVLVPFILGFAGLAAFLYYESYFAGEPTVPIHLFNNWTSSSG